MELGNLPYEVRAFFDFDLEDIISLIAAESGRPYSGDDILKALTPGPRAGHYGFVTQQEITDRLIGWLKAQPESGSASKLEALVVNIVVTPDRRRTGVATAMLNHMIEAVVPAGIKELHAYARPDEESAIAFMKARGFEQDPASDPEALTFVRKLA